VGFIGVGNMGWPMAARLVGGGIQVAVCDSRPERTTAFTAEIGGQHASSPREAATAADILITMLPDSRIVEAVLFDGPDSAANSLARGSIVIEMSSGAPGKTMQFAERLAERGIAMIDAPVSGGVQRAVPGQLAIMIGGADEAIAKCRPVLELMGTSLMKIGGVGTGQAMKALNNLVSAGGFLITAEALLMGRKFGLDPEVMIDVLNVSSGMNNSTQKKFKQFVLSRGFDSGFGLDLMVKDLSIALELGHEAGAAAPFAALCRELWGSAAKTLGSGEDHTAMVKFSETLAGCSLGGNR
jgi:3-hydroxyisobutyrate dehydrogenase